MSYPNKRSFPYIPNANSETRREMLQEIGAADVSELFKAIPEHLIYRDHLAVPGPMDEFHLRRTVSGMLQKNDSPDGFTSFLGAGCWSHFIPAVCDEISQRAEFVTAYAGEPYEDHGRFQALFEYQSLVGELVDMDVVNVPTFDWAQAAATSLRMAARITQRSEVLIPANVDPDKLRVIVNYCRPQVVCKEVAWNRATGKIDMEDLRVKLSDKTAAVYLENPNFMGCIEENLSQIITMIHEVGSLAVVGVDPISLGVLKPPSQFGADIVCGDLQPLGIHMNYGGGQAGFIATHDDAKFVLEYPSRLFGLIPTTHDGEYGFGDVAYERTSFAQREKGKESVGTQTALWGIVAGVYLSLLGPQGMREVGETILQKSLYAKQKLNQIAGVRCDQVGIVHFKEFVVDFNETGQTVEEINKRLLDYSILGGVNLADTFSELGESALYCVTEIHSKEQIDQLAAALNHVLNG